MGDFARNLGHRIRARRGARLIRHPAGAGVVMWCSSCRAELLRAPPGEGLTPEAQQAAVAAHNRVCKVRHLQPVIRPAPPVARRRRRWPWVLAAVMGLAVAAHIVAWLLG